PFPWPRIPPPPHWPIPPAAGSSIRGNPASTPSSRFRQSTPSARAAALRPPQSRARRSAPHADLRCRTGPPPSSLMALLSSPELRSLPARFLSFWGTLLSFVCDQYLQ